MGAQIGHPPAVQHQDAVGLHQRGDAVGHQDHRGGCQGIPQGGTDLCVGLGIHGGQGVVKDHHRRLLHQHPGDGHPLLLAAGQGDAPLAHHGLVPVGKGGDGVIHTGDGGGPAHLLGSGLGPGGADVFTDGLGEQEGLLQHQADVFPQGFPLHFADVHAAHGNGALAVLQVIEPVQKMHQGALARTGTAQDGEGLALMDGKGHVPQHILTLVAEGNVVKDDVAGNRLHRAGDVCLLLRVENIAHAVHGNARLAHLGQHAAQGTHRPGQGFVVGDKGNESAQGHAAVYRLHNAAQHDDHHLQGGKQRAGGPIDRQQLAQTDPQGGKIVVFLAELFFLIHFPAKSAHHPHTGEVFLGAGGQGALRLVRVLEPAGDLGVKYAG